MQNVGRALDRYLSQLALNAHATRNDEGNVVVRAGGWHAGNMPGSIFSEKDFAGAGYVNIAIGTVVRALTDLIVDEDRGIVREAVCQTCAAARKLGLLRIFRTESAASAARILQTLVDRGPLSVPALAQATGISWKRAFQITRGDRDGSKASNGATSLRFHGLVVDVSERPGHPVFQITARGRRVLPTLHDNARLLHTHDECLRDWWFSSTPTTGVLTLVDVCQAFGIPIEKMRGYARRAIAIRESTIAQLFQVKEAA